MQTTRHTPAETTRREALLAWASALLSERGDRVIGVEEMPSAASFRRFLRLRTETGTSVLMDSPPDRENNAQFERLSTFFRSADIPVPEMIGHDVANGFLMVSDLVSTRLGEVYGTGEEDEAIEAALRLLVEIQSLPQTPFIPAYARARLHDEFELFPTWLIQGLLGRAVSASERALLDATRETLIEAMAAQPSCCVHRDFHSQNLIWHERHIGLVDFQDALWGPQCYDLASLLRDCYHRFTEERIAHWRSRFLELAAAAHLACGSHDPDTFARLVDWTALQRQIKAVGIFARLKLRDGRNTHLGDILPVMDQLIDVTFTYPEFAALSRWLRTTVKPDVERALATHV